MWVVKVITGTTVPKRSVFNWGVPYGQPVTATTNRIVECRCEWEGRTCVHYSPTWTIETHTELDGEASPTFFVNLFIYLVQQVTNSFFVHLLYIYISREKITKVLLFWGERINVWWIEFGAAMTILLVGKKKKQWHIKPRNHLCRLVRWRSWYCCCIVCVLLSFVSTFMFDFFNPNICIVSCNVFSKF